MSRAVEGKSDISLSKSDPSRKRSDGHVQLEAASEWMKKEIYGARWDEMEAQYS